MKKILMLGSALIIIGMVTTLDWTPAQTVAHSTTRTWPPRSQPSWVNKGLVIVGNWEPLQWIYRKNWQNWGNARHGAEAEAAYREERSERTVIGLKALGVNMVLTSFNKGFGIANEKASEDDAREFGKILHKHGMKMGVLVDGLLLYEELYQEFPESRNWHRILYDGTPDVYDNDGYRYRAFLNHPQYIAYMKRLCKLAVDSGADLIHFDVINQTPENFHPLAEEMFRQWLKEKYPTRDEWYFRSGLHYWDYVKIPHYAQPLSYETYDQAIMQEYLQFKCQLLADYAAEMSTYIHSLNPEVAVDWVLQGVSGENRALLNNVDFPRVLPWLNSYWVESNDYGSYTEDGRLFSQIRSMKIGQQYNNVVFSYTGPNPPTEDRAVDTSKGDPRLLMAESMAFNRQCLGELGDPLVYKDFPESGRRYIKFFWKDFDLLANGRTAADVAVLRTFPSIAYNNFATHVETMLAEQTLIQSQVPYDMIDDHNLSDLSKYKVVILADQESLADDQIAALREYVRGGGGLVATADTAKYDDWRRDRGTKGMSDLMGLERKIVDASQTGVHQNQFGAGRAAYLPKLIPRIPVPPMTSFYNRYRAPAANREQFLSAIRWAAGGKLNWEIGAPPFVAAEAYYQSDKNRYILHLVNYNYLRQPEVKNLTVAMHVPDVAAVKKVTVYSPDQDSPVELHFTHTSDGLKCILPALNVYSIIAIEK